MVCGKNQIHSLAENDTKGLRMTIKKMGMTIKKMGMTIKGYVSSPYSPIVIPAEAGIWFYQLVECVL
jgi:hypothetical protein